MNTKEDFLSHITLYLLEKNYLDYQDNFSENGDTQRTTPSVTKFGSFFQNSYRTKVLTNS